ncbi:Zn-ribbon domain-containing OB-fold protein [Roseomonas sp. CCTCC AB2023176]|uniref:Zn-ribbon domain-containing OB-fold protein n=1 Tax=Roseomonas sp. CCTCC AB2023176 TaxID=3342640 RepID=UPI0035D6E3F2
MLAPTPDPDNRAFFEAANARVLLLGLCQDTGRPFFYPRGVSPFTLTTNVTTVPASGRGTIHSVTVMRGPSPTAVAYVELAEGPRVFTNIVDCDPNALRIGDAVRLVFAEAEGGQKMPCFTPA